MYICIYVYMYIFTYVYMYVYIHINKFPINCLSTCSVTLEPNADRLPPVPLLLPTPIGHYSSCFVASSLGVAQHGCIHGYLLAYICMHVSMVISIDVHPWPWMDMGMHLLI